MRRHFILAVFAASIFASVSAQAQAPAAPNALPSGDGHDIVAVACTQCHGPSAVTQLREGAQAWRDEVYDMILRGAQVGPNDIEAVVSYLTTNFGPGVPLPGPAPAPVTLPDGQGKETVEGGCAVCHGLGLVAATKRSPAQWQLIVNKMIFYGAPLSPDQANTVVAYLGTQFGTK